MRKFLLLAIFFQAVFLFSTIFSMEQQELTNENSDISTSHSVTLNKNPRNPNEIEIILTPEMHESVKTLMERIASQFGPFVTQTFREHLFFIPEAFSTLESQDWYIENLINLTKAYGFDRVADPILMQTLNLNASPSVILNPLINILKEIYTSESSASEIEKLFLFCDTINISAIKAELSSTTDREENKNMTFAAFYEENAQEKMRIGSFKNLMIATDIGFSSSGKDPIEAQRTTIFAVRSSEIKKSIVRISSLLEKLNDLQTITQRDSYLQNSPKS